jgi:hypothetical protein
MPHPAYMDTLLLLTLAAVVIVLLFDYTNGFP